MIDTNNDGNNFGQLTRVRVSRRMRLVSVGIFIIVVAGIAFVYWVPVSSFASSLFGIKTRVTDTVYVAARPFTPTGTIYLSLAPQSDTTTNGIYAFGVSSGVLSSFFNPTSTLSVSISFPASFGNDVLLATNARTSTSSARSQAMQISRYSPATGVLMPITTSSLERKRNPMWVGSIQNIIFDAKSPNSQNIVTPDDYSVYTHASDGSDKVIAQGAIPALVPGGAAVVVLRNDGLHLVSLTSSTTALIWPLNHGAASLNQQFSISPNGDSIAWSIPQDGKIYIMSVSSWTPFVGHVTQSIPTHAFWPTFSPDGQYLAFEEVDWGPIPTNPRLTIEDLVTPQKKSMYDLSGFLQTRMFISSWHE